MVGITTLHKIFEGRKEIPESELKAGLVSGGVVALAEKLRTSHAWNGINLLAAPMLTLEGRRCCGQPLGGLEKLCFN